MIACVVIPNFAASIEYLRQPQLGAAPLVIGDYTKRRAQVYATSAEASALHIVPGMTLSKARGLCPHALFVPAAPEYYQHTVEQILEALWTFSDRVEVEGTTQTGVFYVDLGHCTELEGVYFGERIIDALRQSLALIANVGTARGKFAAFVSASGSLPGRAACVQVGQEATFLAPHSVSLLPMSKEMRRRLELFHIKTLAEFAALSRSAVLSQFGKPGLALHHLANGYDTRPVKAEPLKKVEAARKLFELPLTDFLQVEQVLQTIATQLSRRLQANAQGSRRIHLTLRLDRHTPHNEVLQLSTAIAGTQRIFEVLRRTLSHLEISSGITEIGVVMADLVAAIPQQLDLFTYKPQQQMMREAIADLIARYGGECFYEVIEIDQEAFLFERRFTLQALMTAPVTV